MNDSSDNESLLLFRPMYSAFPPPTDMPDLDERTKERPLPAPSIQSPIHPSFDFAEKGFRRFYQRSIDSSAAGSNDSSPTTTISTADDSSATEPSPGSSPESPPPNTLTGGMLRPRTADDIRPFFELQKQLPPKKGRNLKNLAVNTARPLGKGASASMPLPTSNAETFASDSASTFVKPQTPSSRKPSSLGLTLLTPGSGRAPPIEMKLAIPSTPALIRPGTLRHFQSSPSLPLFPTSVSGNGERYPSTHITCNLETIMSPVRTTLSKPEEEEEQNFDIPLSQEEKPEAYPDGPICVYEPYIDLYLEPTVAQAKEYDVIMNVANEVRNPFTAIGNEAPDEPEIRIDGGGGIQYAPKRDRIPQQTMGTVLQAEGSPTTPKATPLRSNFSIQDISTPSEKEPEYIHVRWEHNSDIVPDLLQLVKLLDEKVMEGKRVLIHCQCGVSRSASLVVAYGLYKNPSLSVQEAYDAVKQRSKWIGPNMNLIMQLQEFRTSLMRGGLLSSNRGVTPITPSSALSEWRSPFAITSPSLDSPPPIGTAPLVRTLTPEQLPVLADGSSSAPSDANPPEEDRLALQRARAVSAVKATTAFVDPSGRVLPVVPVLKVVEADPEESLFVPEIPTRADDAYQSSSSVTPTELVRKTSTEDFAMTPLQPSPDVDSADSFGLMSPTSTEFSSSPFDRSMLLASLGMGPIGQQEDLGPRRSISLRSRRDWQQTKDESTISAGTERKSPRRLRGKISSPDFREQRELQLLQTRIEASVPRKVTPFSSLDSIEEPLMSPRATEFTQNPFALPTPQTEHFSESDAVTAAGPEYAVADPRSPALKGGSPIVRSILDVL